MPRSPSEFQIQRAFCIWYGGEKRRDGTWKVEPAQLPGVVWWHTPNNAKRDDSADSAAEGFWLKQIGLLAGVPDLLFLWGGLYGLELKAAGKKRSKAQIDLHPRLIAAGAKVATVDSLQAAKDQVRAWGLVSC